MQDNLYFHSKEDAQAFLTELTHIYPDNNKISRSQDHGADIKWGLRNADGTGVMAGLTQVGSVMGYYMEDGEKVPMPGKLYYRGINVEDLIHGFVSEKRFGFEETAFLLLHGPPAQPRRSWASSPNCSARCAPCPPCSLRT